MGGHVVIAFQIMQVFRQALRNQLVENGLEIQANSRVGIFVDTKSGGCMVDENVQQPGFGQLYLAKDVFVDQMKSSGIGRQYDIKMRQHGNEWMNGSSIILNLILSLRNEQPPKQKKSPGRGA